MYEVGPVTAISTTKFLIMANVSFKGNNHGIQVTVGRATSSGANASASTNIVSNISPLVLPITSSATSYYMMAQPTNNDSSDYLNLNGTAIDIPGAGTFYYTIWMSSSSAHNYTTMTAFLTVLKIQE